MLGDQAHSSRYALYTSLFRIALVVISGGFLCSCATRSPYQGYKYKPYIVKSTRYYPLHPRASVGHVEYGIASHYREGNWLFPGKTALGERFRASAMEGAHKTLPIPCRIKVINLHNRRAAILRINDRGPYIRGRILDVTPAVAKKLGFYAKGITRVRIVVLSVGEGRYLIRR